MKNQKPFSYFHSTPIQIRFNDIDQLGHVTNSVYQQYFDLGRMAYFREVLEEPMDWNIEGLILAGINIDYINSIELYDTIIVRTKIVHLGNKSLKMSQELFDQTSGEVCATSNSTMVAYCNSSKSTLPIPERWRKKIASYERDILFEVKVD